MGGEQAGSTIRVQEDLGKNLSITSKYTSLDPKEWGMGIAKAICRENNLGSIDIVHKNEALLYFL